MGAPARAALVGGLMLATALIVWSGAGDVAAALLMAGPGLGWLAPVFLASLALAALAWASLFPPAVRPPFRLALAASWIGVAVNALMPVAQIGGDVVKGVWLARRRGGGATVAASVAADKAIQAVAQALMALLGAGLMVAGVAESGLAIPAAAFSVLLLTLALLFWRAQAGAALLRRAGAARLDGLWNLAGGAARLHAAVLEVHGSTRRVAASLGWRVLSRLVLAAEVWVILHLVGHPLGWLEALALESLLQAVRAAAFAVPGAVGVQEGGFIVVGGALGVPAELALAVSLAKRAREVLVGLPALLLWQATERPARRARRPPG